MCLPLFVPTETARLQKPGCFVSGKCAVISELFHINENEFCVYLFAVKDPVSVLLIQTDVVHAPGAREKLVSLAGIILFDLIKKSCESSRRWVTDIR